MTTLAFIATLLTLAALFGFLNLRLLHLPSSIGALVIALAVSLVIALANPTVAGIGLRALAAQMLAQADLPAALMEGVLSFLLFAGALHVDVVHLWSRKWTVLALATVGTVIAVFMLGGVMWGLFAAVGTPVPLAWCIVLGAILAPTDPVSVVGLLRRIGLPPGLQAVFAGESLFNDGVGVVLFGVALKLALGGSFLSPGAIAAEIAIEAAGGAAVGLVAGGLAVLMMRQVDDYNLELTISLALATGAFSLANALHLSGPIAAVMGGLMVGSETGLRAMSALTRQHVMVFWSLVDDVLNTLLFLVIGLQVVAISLSGRTLLAALAVIPMTLVVRAISVVVPTILLHLRTPNLRGAIAVLTWGGLRGGISVALALSLPPGPAREPILTVCYLVVVFSIIVQGLTMQRVAAWFYDIRPGPGTGSDPRHGGHDGD